ncbi:MAG TPA: APC family permease [Myxococcota bacterium]|nr:APC family permease [Myxococcota bacterium]
MPSPLSRVRRALVGAPRSLADTGLFHRISLIPFLAWVGLGADGLSSSSYGPEEAFRTLGPHTYLAVGLAVAMAATVFIISAAYSRIIEEFPHGGGGYVVATKLLGERAGVVSGSALLVDYVLTITVSIAAAGDALFSFAPLAWHSLKLPLEVGFIGFLTVLNLRGVRESVLALSPVFLLFIATHVILIGGSLLVRAPDLPSTAHGVSSGFRDGFGVLGAAGLFLLFVHAFSLGGGTYTGIEAVSNGLPIMREPRVQTARRTMAYMATSLAFTATGLLLCYLLWQLAPVEGKTMNAVLAERVAEGRPFAAPFVWATLFSEGALLVVAAQAGFIDGPRVLANMAVDSWLPRRFSALSDRLTTQNGILLMGGAALAALVYTRGDVRAIVVMYSINVFLTFSLSMLGMAISWLRSPGRPHRKRRASLFVVGFVLCAGILGVTVTEKFAEGGWVTMAVTGSLVALCFVVRRHYRDVGGALTKLYKELEDLPPEPEVVGGAALAPVDAHAPTAAVLVASYGGLGIHTAVNIFATFPGHFKNVVFLSVGVIDSGAFKGEDAMKSLVAETEATLQRYVDLAARLGVPATSRFSVGTDAVQEAETLCLAVKREFPRATFFAGKVVFREERWFQKLLHNETAFAIQKRLQFAGQTMVILPARVT